MNPAVMMAYNCLELTRKAVDSILAQDIPVHLVVCNNGSTDGTKEYLESLPEIESYHYPENISPLKIANERMKDLFGRGAGHVLGVPNDATFPPNLYSELLKFPFPFVSAGMACIEDPPPRQDAVFLHHDCHFSAILVSKFGHDSLVSAFGNFFDPDYFHYASDVDMKQRWVKIGLQGCQTSIQCYHYGSATWRHPSVPEWDKKRMLEQADRDRATYYRKWGERL